MKTMTKDQLVDSLSSYGYYFLTPEQNKAEEVLENLLEQDDSRLLEGFPVVLLNALQNNRVLRWEDGSWDPAKLSFKARERMPYLLAVSLSLFEKYSAGDHHVSRVTRLLDKFPNGREALRDALKESESDQLFKMGGADFSLSRFENAFQTYAFQNTKKPKAEQKKAVYGRELLLSQLFTPRQKKLLQKKLEGQSLEKTEREYYSRVLKKRLMALADNELHEWAGRLLK